MPADLRVRFPSSSIPSRILIRSGALARLGSLALRATGARRAVLVTDPRVWALHGGAAIRSLRRAEITVSAVRIPRGERAKRASEVERLWRAFARLSIGRRDVAVALGGGVVGDVAGFAAATWLRGVSWVDYVQAAVGEYQAVPGVIQCVQTFGSVAHLHPHLHVLLTDGAFRWDRTFVPLPVPEPAVLEESWRRSVLAEFVRRGWLEEDAAAGMLVWPHSGFGAYLGARIEEREGLLRVVRYSARAPVAESRLRYDAERAEVELVADRNDGPYAGVHRMWPCRLG